MYSEAWSTLALFALLLGLAGSQPALVLLGLLLLAVLPLGRWWSRRALDDLHYLRRLSETRIFPGETVDLEVEVRNQKLLPLSWLRLEDPFPSIARLEGRELQPAAQPLTAYLAHRTSLAWYEGVRWRYRLHLPARGVYFLGPVRAASGDGFGLFSERAEMGSVERIIVYPRVVPMERLGIPSKQPFGERLTPQRLYADPSRPAGVRDYAPGDPFRLIHWKATAHRQRLQLKVHEATTTDNVALVLNVATFAQPWQGTDPELLEHSISVAASLAYHLTQEKASVGLLANGSWPRSDQPLRVLPSRHPGQLTRVLESLAAVTSFPTNALEVILAREVPRLPYVATLVVVSCVLTQPLQQQLQELRRRGRRLALVHTHRHPPRIEGGFDFPVYHVPPPPGVAEPLSPHAASAEPALPQGEGPLG